MVKLSQRWRLHLMSIASAIALMSCTKQDAASSTEKLESKGQTAMTASTKCAANTFSQYSCIVEMMLTDINAEYSWVSGNVSEIKTLSPMTYQVTIPQDERADIYTYEFEVAKNGGLAIKSKKESTRSY